MTQEIRVHLGLGGRAPDTPERVELDRRRLQEAQPTGIIGWEALGADQLFAYELGLGTTVSGGDVVGLEDLATQGVQNDLDGTGHGPTWVSSGGLSNLPYARFEKGSSEWLGDVGVGIMPAAVQPYIWIVGRFHTAVASNDTFVRIRSFSNSHGLEVQVGSGNVWELIAETTAGSIPVTGPAISLGNWHLLRLYWDGSQVGLRVDDGAPATASLAGTMNLDGSNGQIVMAAANVAGTNPGNADAFMVIGSAQQPTVATHEKVLERINLRTGQNWTP